MRKTSWKRVAAVLGIALLAVAVGLMPACDSGGGGTGPTVDACEAINGIWNIKLTDVKTTCGPYLDLGPFPYIFSVDNGTVTINGKGPLAITCASNQFSISGEVTLPVPGYSDCTMTTQWSIDGRFTSGNAFTSTGYEDSTLSGSGCPSPYCAFTSYTMTGTRL